MKSEMKNELLSAMSVVLNTVSKIYANGINHAYHVSYIEHGFNRSDLNTYLRGILKHTVAVVNKSDVKLDVVEYNDYFSTYAIATNQKRLLADSETLKHWDERYTLSSGAEAIDIDANGEYNPPVIGCYDSPHANVLALAKTIKERRVLNRMVSGSVSREVIMSKALSVHQNDCVIMVNIADILDKEANLESHLVSDVTYYHDVVKSIVAQGLV